ncbi:MAG: hypothetical protein HY958_09975 [Bacteroidia bacterium]|nr:hypothetical protein [Bacteroidia bacterium]
MEEQINQTASGEDKTIAIVSYMTLIGWIIALVMHGSNKTKLGGFHLRQMLGLIIVAVAISIVNFILAFIPFLGWLISLLLVIGMVIFWIMGLISAVNGEMKPLPLIGEPIQKILKDFAN